MIKIRRSKNLGLIDPDIVGWHPADDFLVFEPEVDFLLGGFRGIRAVADVAANHHTIITTDRTWCRSGRIGSAQHVTSTLDDSLAFPHHGYDRSRGEELGESLEERLGFEVIIVTSRLCFRGLDKFHGDQHVTLLFKALNDFANQSAVHTIRLDGNEGTFILGARYTLSRDGRTHRGRSTDKSSASDEAKRTGGFQLCGNTTYISQNSASHGGLFD